MPSETVLSSVKAAATLILEDWNLRASRGATILAEMAGYGASGDAYHITQPLEDGSGAAQAMQAALDKAGWQPQDVDYINAHGTSTPLNDRMETKAIKSRFRRGRRQDCR